MAYPTEKKRKKLKKNPDLKTGAAYARANGLTKEQVKYGKKTGKIKVDKDGLISEKENKKNIDLRNNILEDRGREQRARANLMEMKEAELSGSLVAYSKVVIFFKQVFEELEKFFITKSKKLAVELEGKSVEEIEEILKGSFQGVVRALREKIFGKVNGLKDK